MDSKKRIDSLDVIYLVSFVTLTITIVYKFISLI